MQANYDALNVVWEPVDTRPSGCHSWLQMFSMHFPNDIGYLLLYGSQFIHFFCSGTFLASEYLFSAPRGLDEFIHFFFVAVFFPLPSIFSLSPWGLDEFTHFFFSSGIVPDSEYLFSAARGLFILVAFFPLPSIFSALLEDSKKSIISTRFCSLFSRYLEYLRN